jgi:hypothetical protein
LRHLRLPSLFCGGTTQLPKTQRAGKGHSQQGDQQDPHKAQGLALCVARLWQPSPNHPIIFFMTYLVAIAFLAILGSLGAALFYMMKGDGQSSGKHPSGGMAKALAFRVGFSIVLFICILLAWKLGYIQPSGIPAGA